MNLYELNIYLISKFYFSFSKNVFLINKKQDFYFLFSSVKKIHNYRRIYLLIFYYLIFIILEYYVSLQKNKKI